jgi:hypothetical protein
VAVETEPQPIEVESVRDEERFFGGDIVWWCLLLLVSGPVLLGSVALMPSTGGFLLLALGGVMAGVGFTEVVMRLPYFGNGFAKSLLIVIVAAIILCGIWLAYNSTLDVPQPPLDTSFKPPISGG